MELAACAFPYVSDPRLFCLPEKCLNLYRQYKLKNWFLFLLGSVRQAQLALTKILLFPIINFN